MALEEGCKYGHYFSCRQIRDQAGKFKPERADILQCLHAVEQTLIKLGLCSDDKHIKDDVISVSAPAKDGGRMTITLRFYVKDGSKRQSPGNVIQEVEAFEMRFFGALYEKLDEYQIPTIAVNDPTE